MATSSISQKSSASLGRAAVRPCRVARTAVVVKASKKNNVEAAIQAVGTQAVTAALAVAMCVMAPAPAQALLPFRADYQAQLDNIASGVQNKVSSDINNTKGKAREVQSAVDNKLGNPAASVTNAAKSTIDKVKANLPLGSVPNVGNKVQSDIQATKSKALDVKGSVDNKLDNPLDAVGAKAESALEKVKSVLPIGTLPSAGEVGNKISNKVSSDINNTKSAANNAKGSVDNKLGNPIDAIGAKANSLGDKIKANLPLGALPSAGEVGNKISNKVSNDINNTKSAANNAKGSVDNKLGNPIDAIGAKANSLGDKIKANLPLGALPSAGEVGNKVSNKVSNDINNTKSAANNIKGNVDNKLGNPIDAVGAKANSAFDKIKANLPLGALPSAGEIGNQVSNKVSNDINNTKSAANDVKSNVDNKLGNPVDAIGAKANSLGDKIKANLPLGNLPSANDVGNKVQSDINTTANKAGEVKGAVQNQVQGNSVTDALGDAGDAAKGAFDSLKSNLSLGNIAGASGNGQGTGEGVAAGKAKEQQTQQDAASSGQKVKDFVLGTSYGKQ